MYNLYNKIRKDWAVLPDPAGLAWISEKRGEDLQELFRNGLSFLMHQPESQTLKPA